MSKKDIVLNKKRGSSVYIVIIAVLVAVVALLLIPGKGEVESKDSENSKEVIISQTSQSLGEDRYKLVKADNGLVKFPVTSFGDEAQYFKYDVNGKEVRFFILKSNDGTIRAAFDACDVCFRAKRGYDQQGDFMRCNNCGLTFPEDQINVVQGGCNPAPLDREIVGNNLVIKVEDIALGQRFF